MLSSFQKIYYHIQCVLFLWKNVRLQFLRKQIKLDNFQNIVENKLPYFVFLQNKLLKNIYFNCNANDN